MTMGRCEEIAEVLVGAMVGGRVENRARVVKLAGGCWRYLGWKGVTRQA